MHAYLIVSDAKTREDLLRQQLDACGIHPHDCVYPASDGRAIGIEAIHDFIARLGLSPLHGTRTAGIIPDADALTPVAMQALLKTLEEPPGSAYLFLGTSNAARLPATVVSRCHIRSSAGSTSEEPDPKERQFIETLLAASAGHKIELLDTLGADNAALSAWLDRAIRIVRSDLADAAAPPETRTLKRRVLRGFLEAKRYHANNVNVRLLIEHALLQTA